MASFVYTPEYGWVNLDAVTRACHADALGGELRDGLCLYFVGGGCEIVRGAAAEAVLRGLRSCLADVACGPERLRVYAAAVMGCRPEEVALTDAEVRGRAAGGRHDGGV
jgi:hypothetical protein